MPEPRIIVFLKAPRPGEVKTRLARYMGEKAACKAYIQLTETLLAKLTSLPQIEIRYTPDDAEEEILCWLRPGWTTAPQGTGDLGMRMNRAFEETSCPTLLIGSDCPYLEPSDLKAAADALQEHDIVIGPATDGGYWLIGLNAPYPELFKQISWSTSTVLEETLAQAEADELSAWLGRTLSDVDTHEDWINWNKGSVC